MMLLGNRIYSFLCTAEIDKPTLSLEPRNSYIISSGFFRSSNEAHDNFGCGVVIPRPLRMIIEGKKYVDEGI
jgi:hypothetical protein